MTRRLVPDTASRSAPGSALRCGSARFSLASLANISVVAAAMALSKLLGFGEKRMLAEFFGATATVDIYFVTVAALSAIFYFVRELCDPVLLPWLVEHGDRHEARASIGAVQLGVVFALGLGASAAAVLWAWPEQVAVWLAPGIVGPERIRLASFLELAGLGLPLLCLSAVTQVVLNARGRFGWAAGADVAMKAVLLGGVVLAGIRDQFLVLGLAYVGAAFARLAAHWPSAQTLLDSCTARWELSARDRQTLWLIAAPLLAATALSQCRELIENHFASRLGSGAIAAQGYAKRMIDIPLVVAAQAIAVVGFREIAASTKAPDGQLASAALGCIRRILMVVLPVAALTAFFSDELVTAALGAKNLGPEGRRLTAAALGMYALSLPVLAVEPALLATHYVLRNTRAPLIAGVVALPLEVSLLVIAIDGWGIRAIAGAILAAKAVKLAFLCWLLPRDVRRASAVEARATLVAPLAAFGLTCAAASALRSVSPVSLGWEFGGAALASSALFAASTGAVFLAAEHLLARRWGSHRGPVRARRAHPGPPAPPPRELAGGQRISSAGRITS